MPHLAAWQKHAKPHYYWTAKKVAEEIINRSVEVLGGDCGYFPKLQWKKHFPPSSCAVLVSHKPPLSRGWACTLYLVNCCFYCLQKNQIRSVQLQQSSGAHWFHAGFTLTGRSRSLDQLKTPHCSKNLHIKAEYQVPTKFTHFKSGKNKAFSH